MRPIGGGGALDGHLAVIATLAWHHPRPVSLEELARALGRPTGSVTILLRHPPLAEACVPAPEVPGHWVLAETPAALTRTRRFLHWAGDSEGWWGTMLHLAGWPSAWIAPAPGSQRAWYLGTSHPDRSAPIDQLTAYWLAARVLTLPGDPVRWGIPGGQVRWLRPTGILEES